MKKLLPPLSPKSVIIVTHEKLLKYLMGQAKNFETFLEENDLHLGLID